MSELQGARRRDGGFTLMELMVTMTITAALMGMGAGLFMSMGKRTASENALSSISSLIVNVRNASSNYPASLVVDPQAGTIQAMAQEVRQELHFDPRRFEGVSADVYEQGIEGRNCTWLSSQVEPTSGRVGGALRLGGGKVDCGTQPAYDVTNGLTVELWMKPDTSGSADLVKKGDALLVRLEGGGRITATIGVRDEKNTERVSLTVPIPQVRPNQWLGVRVTYDTVALTIETNSGFGWMVRGSPKAESRKLAPSPDAPLLVGGYNGLLDDFRFAGVHSTEPITMPTGVKLVGTKPISIHFLNGHLDPAHEFGPARVAMESAGRRTTLQIEMNGMMTVAYTDAAVEAPVSGPDQPKGPAKKE